MKKKLIENMPLPRIPKGVTGFVAIARSPEKGLVVVDYIDAEVNVLVLRIGLRKWEYMNYLPDSSIWNQVDIRDIRHHLMLMPGDPYETEIISGKSHLEKMFGMSHVASIENRIKWTIQSDRERARANRVEARNSMVQELSEKEKEWLCRYLEPMHFAYYRRKNRKIDIACTACGKSGTFYISKYDLSLEEFAIAIDTPEHNMYGDCPICGARVQFKAAGKAKGVYEKTDYRYIISKYGESDIVLRYFEVYKRFSGDEHIAQETMTYYEVGRTFFCENKMQRDYQKYNYVTGTNFWDDRNLAGLANIIKRAGKVYKGNLDFLADTRFKYACVEKQLIQNDYTNMEDYFSAYIRYPFIEMLQKLNMTKMIEYIITYHNSTQLFDNSRKDGPGIFKITKERFNRMYENNLGVEMLKIFQMEKEKNIRLPDNELEACKKYDLDVEQIEIILTYTSITKAVNYIRKRPQITGYGEHIRKYTDYLKLCKDNDRDMTNPHKVFPADLDEAHNTEVLYKSREELKIKMREKNKKNPEIKKDAAGYNKQYMYQDDKYIIRAPKNAGEIYKEGVILSHCVGRAGYIEAMNRHETVILFLRKKDKPNIPYYTIEVKNGEIKQAYGKSDEKPDWDEVNPFLKSFTKARLKKKRERKVG